jgi:hypothetical protein
MEIPTVVIADEQFRLSFYCTFPDQSLCPPYYRVFFHGPSRQSISPENFTSVHRTNNRPHDYATVQASWIIQDPGEYAVYAYPDFPNCTQWKNMEYPWFRASVQSTPFHLTVKLSTSQHLLWIGDSTTRGPFCSRVWEAVHGTVSGSVCDYKAGLQSYWEMDWGHKFTAKIFDQGNVSLSFLWCPTNIDAIIEPLLALTPPPTHVIFNMGMYLNLFISLIFLDG